MLFIRTSTLRCLKFAFNLRFNNEFILIVLVVGFLFDEIKFTWRLYRVKVMRNTFADTAGQETILHLIYFMWWVNSDYFAVNVFTQLFT